MGQGDGDWEQKTEQLTGQGKGRGVAVREGARLIWATPAKKFGPHPLWEMGEVSPCALQLSICFAHLQPLHLFFPSSPAFLVPAQHLVSHPFCPLLFHSFPSILCSSSFPQFPFPPALCCPSLPGSTRCFYFTSQTFKAKAWFSEALGVHIPVGAAGARQL